MTSSGLAADSPQEEKEKHTSDKSSLCAVQHDILKEAILTSAFLKSSLQSLAMTVDTFKLTYLPRVWQCKDTDWAMGNVRRNHGSTYNESFLLLQKCIELSVMATTSCTGAVTEWNIYPAERRLQHIPPTTLPLGEKPRKKSETETVVMAVMCSTFSVLPFSALLQKFIKLFVALNNAANLKLLQGKFGLRKKNEKCSSLPQQMPLRRP